MCLFMFLVCEAESSCLAQGGDGMQTTDDGSAHKGAVGSFFFLV